MLSSVANFQQLYIWIFSVYTVHDYVIELHYKIYINYPNIGIH